MEVSFNFLHGGKNIKKCKLIKTFGMGQNPHFEQCLNSSLSTISLRLRMEQLARSPDDPQRIRVASVFEMFFVWLILVWKQIF